MNLVAEAERILGKVATFDAELGSMTTYRVGGRAAVAVHPTSESDLEAVSEFLRATSCEVLIVGRGSNMLISDRGFAGLAVFTDALTEHLDMPDSKDTSPTVRASANTLLPVLARRCAGAGWCGLGWSVGVPGTVGGAVRMNAGGHGSDMAASLRRVRAFDLVAGRGAYRDVSELGLRFRGSRLTPSEVVLSAEFVVRKCDPSEANSEIEEIVRWRRENQPGGQNAGSVFVNPKPNELSAGEVIDNLGLRGKRHGSAEVSTKHANFIQADPGGKADDVAELMALVRREVHERTGIELRSEIRLVGFGAEMTSAAGGTV